MWAIDSWLDPVETYNTRMRRFARVFRRPALGTDEKEMSPTLQIIELDVVNVLIVEQLGCSQLLVRAEAFTVKLWTKQQVLDGLHSHMGYLPKSWNRPTSSDPHKGREASIRVANVGWNWLLLRGRRTFDLCTAGRQSNVICYNFKEVILRDPATMSDVKCLAKQKKQECSTTRSLKRNIDALCILPAHDSELWHFHPLQIGERRRWRRSTHSWTRDLSSVLDSQQTGSGRARASDF